MKFNPCKYEVLHFGRSNVKEKYTVNDRTLNTIEAQKDLGVQVHSSLKVATQVEKVVKKAYDMLAFIGQGIEYKGQDVMLQLFKTLRKISAILIQSGQHVTPIWLTLSKRLCCVQGFPNSIVNRPLNQVQPISRTSALTLSLPSRNSDRVPLILTYHATSIHIQKIIR
eukprot:g30429.t1